MMVPIKLIFISFFFLVGCAQDFESRMSKLRNEAKSKVSDSEDQIMRTLISSLQAHDPNTATNLISNKIRIDEVKKSLIEMEKIFSERQVISAEPIGYNNVTFHSFVKKNSRIVTIDYEVKFNDGYFTFLSIRLTSSDQDELKIEDIYMQDGPILVKKSTFLLDEKPLLNYLFLIFILLVPAFTIVVACVCFRTRPKRRWLWILFIIFPVGVFKLNWPVNQISFDPLGIILFGGSFMHRSPLQPAFVLVGVPVGAMLFLALKNQLRRNSNFEQTAPLEKSDELLPQSGTSD